MKRLDEVRTAMNALEDPLSAFEGFFAFAPVGLLLFSREGRPLIENDAFRKIFGYSLPRDYDIRTDDQIKRIGLREHVAEAFAGKIVRVPKVNFDPSSWQHLGANSTSGRALVVDWTMFPVFDHSGAIRYVAAVIQDVTAESVARVQHKRAEKRFSSLFQSESISICSASPDGRFFECNRAFLDLLGYAEQEMSAGNMRWDAMTPAEFAPNDQAALEELNERGSFNGLQKEFIRKDGTRVPVLISGALVGEGEVISVVHNMTRYKELEEKFRQAQKMEAIGRLAGGIAHDFNNILGLIFLHSETAIEASQGAAKAELEALRDAAIRGSVLTRQLLAVGSKQIAQPVKLTLGRAVGDLERMLKRLIGENVKLEFGASTNNPTIMADPGQIEQIVLNLIINARDAVGAGGVISITTCGATLSQSEIERMGLTIAPGAYAVLTVKDNGCGMTDDVVSRMFEPFFTTKPQGKGTGLGLPTVFGIVTQYNGGVNVTTSPGKGTCFDIYLPACEPSAMAAQRRDDERLDAEPAQVADKVSVTHAEVLIAEDDQELRGVVAGVLRKKGYKVLEASNGAEALALFRANIEKIDLIISDVIMPEMTGPMMYRELAEDRTRPRILYMSGYPADELSQFALNDSATFFVEKPFTRATLLKKIEEALA